MTKEEDATRKRVEYHSNPERARARNRFMYLKHRENRLAARKGRYLRAKARDRAIELESLNFESQEVNSDQA